MEIGDISYEKAEIFFLLIKPFKGHYMYKENKKKPGRPKKTWRRVIIIEMAWKGHSQNIIHQLSKDKERWKELYLAYDPQGSNEGLSSKSKELLTQLHKTQTLEKKMTESSGE